MKGGLVRRAVSTVDLPLLLLFVTPILASVSGGAVVMAVAFPAAAGALALWWEERDPARFVKLLLWTFILAPGVRHFVELYSGYSQNDPIMLAPYFVVLAATPRVILYLLSGRRYAMKFLLMCIGALYGLALGLGIMGTYHPVLVAMMWLVPLWVAIYVCARANSLAKIRDAANQTFCLAVPVIALYGIAQFVDVTPWDAYFMTASWQEASFNSIGFPNPFEVRVFATMNSPDSLAAMLGTGLLLMPPTGRARNWIAIPMGLAALLLTAERAAWGAFIAALLVMMIVGRDPAMRKSVARLAVAVAMVFCILISVPKIAQPLKERVGSFLALSEDHSARERWQTYAYAISALDSSTLGRGLDWINNDSYGNQRNETLDSGLIDIFTSLGIPGGTIFLVGMFALAFQGIRIARHAADPRAASEFAAAFFGFAQLPFMSQFEGVAGVFLYLALGLLLARAIAVPSRDQQFKNVQTHRISAGPQFPGVAAKH
jgi:hypothetical protein